MRVNFFTENKNTIDEVNQFIEEWYSETEYMTVRTSGSTGTPKEIQLYKKHLVTSAKMTRDHLGLEKNGTALLCLSPKTIAGKMMIIRSIIIGMDLTITNVSGNPLEGINEGFDFTAMVPIQLENSIHSKLSTLQKMKTILVGGGSVSNGLIDRIAELSCQVHHTFGMTETISHIAMRNLSKKENKFKALPNVHFSLQNECLLIQAPELGVFDLKTTDTVELTSPTSFIWKGRKDFVINSGGIKIHPEEIEQILSQMIAAPFFIIGLEDSKLGNKVVMCIESKETNAYSKSTFTNLLDIYQIPKEIYFFNTFCRTESNKINKLETITVISDAKKQVL